ncbi:hypothetical protein Slin15195_G014030 [Septoria linicola]|uniref:Uncharacterized protein n=1 Tax=Septoria linicola TaxID=215465 RepID=A0A9Q9AHY5_9PEZI|nr:hypothetical protein Slin14017_G014070 [Septoria linicola]USW48084.1 hypothetical protein Slin15195_G014030 [Septoria linicola]
MEQSHKHMYCIKQRITTKAPRTEYVHREGHVGETMLSSSLDLLAANEQAIELFLQSTRPRSDKSLSSADLASVLDQKRKELKEQCGGNANAPGPFSGRAVDFEGRLVEISVQRTGERRSTVRPKKKVKHDDEDEAAQLKLLRDEMAGSSLTSSGEVNTAEAP